MLVCKRKPKLFYYKFARKHILQRSLQHRTCDWFSWQEEAGDLSMQQFPQEPLV